ncbi:MAG TPA: hypothetical protein VLG40_01015 [Candidatus Saccharimonas sp.]|nr:hypothetical protein [Candidatus Saccharimonas sp.]
MRKYLGLAVIATLLATGCTTQEAGAADPQTSVVVSPNGGSYAVGGMTVAVPKGAVANPTLLTVGDTRVVSGVNAPLGSVAVRFNISLQGGMEPAQPLQLAIPLAGRFLPAGAQLANAVFYTSTSDNKGYRLLPYTVQNGTLTTTVPHLSDKEIAFVDPQKVAQSISHTQSAPVQSDCTKQQLPNVGEVDVAADNNGNGRVGLCLKLDGGNLALHLTDKSNYTWSVQTPGGLQFGLPLETADDVADRAITATLLHEPDVNSYVLHGGELDVKNITPQNLPLTISLLTSNNGLLGEALWDVVKVMVEFYTGENAEGTAKLVQGLIVDVPDVNKCLVGVFNARSGNIGDFLQALPDAVFGKCGETIGNALIKLLPDAASLINPFTRTLAILQATWEVLQGAWHAAIAVAQTAQGPVKVTIEPACPTKQQFEQAFIGWNAGDSQHRVVSATATSNPTDPNLVCEDAWAIDGMSFTIDNIAPPNNSVGAGVIEHWVNGKWTIVFVSQDMRSDEVCRQVPPKIKQQMQCFN